MNVLIIDWLGRAGIAQCSDAASTALRGHGADTTIVTIGGRELSGPNTIGVDPSGNRIIRHRRLAHRASQLIRSIRPDCVIVQNYVLPMLERPIVTAAASVGAKLVWFVHDHEPHSLFAGYKAGLSRNLARADLVVTHSQYVADRLPRPAPRQVEVLPLPSPAAYRVDPTVASPLPRRRGELIGLHFGVLKRSYKGSELVSSLATVAPPPWTFAAVGVGAPPPRHRLASIDSFVPAAQLAAIVADADATLLPYRHASQSGAVAQSQFSGTVPIASAVGGIREQIDHGRTGLLIESEAGVESWSDALVTLSDPRTRASMALAGQEQAAEHQRSFEERLHEIVQ